MPPMTLRPRSDIIEIRIEFPKRPYWIIEETDNDINSGRWLPSLMYEWLEQEFSATAFEVLQSTRYDKGEIARVRIANEDDRMFFMLRFG